MKLYFPVTVDLYNIYPLPIMNTQQYNIGRGALVTLTAAGQLVVPSAEQLYIYAKKKDGTLVYASCTLSGDQIKVDYDEQMTAVPGTIQMELQMIDGNGNSITTPIFLVNVQPSNIDYKAITSSDEFTALLDALEKVENAANSSEITTTDTEGIVGPAGESVSNQAIIDALAERAVSDRSMLSDAFSAEKPYAIGDYAIYENTLYKFTSAKTAGTWDAAKVQAVTVAGELNSLSEDLASANTQIDELNENLKWKAVDTSAWSIASGVEIKLAEYNPSIKEMHIVFVYTGTEGIPNGGSYFVVPQSYAAKYSLIGLIFYTFSLDVNKQYDVAVVATKNNVELYALYSIDTKAYEHRADIRYTVI